MILRFDNINSFGDWTKSNLLENKVVIVENLKEGSIIQDTLLKLGYNSINLNFKTVGELVKENTVYRLAKDNLKYISYTQCIYEMEKILISLMNEDKLGYFKDIKINKEVARIFYNTYLELNLEDIKTIPSLNNQDKVNSLNYIYKSYAQRLQSKGYIDKVELYNRALNSDNNTSNNPTYFIELRENSFSKIERKIIENITNEKYDFNKLDKIYSLNDLKTKNISCFSSRGERNELYEIIRRIKKEKINFEDVAIYYTDNKYNQLIYEISQSLNINASFLDGISISNSTQAKLIYNLISWIKSNYDINKLYNLLNYISFKEFNKLNNESTISLNSSKVKNILLDLNISKGKDRYFEVLNNERANLIGKISTLDESKQKDYYGNKLNTIDLIIKFFENIFNNIIEDEANYKDVIEGIKYILKTYSISNNDNIKHSSIKALEEVFKELENIEDTLDTNEILDNIEKEIREKNILSSRELSGAIYVANYKNGLWVNRKHSFIVGLDNKKFPKDIVENPLILDYEREDINKLGYDLELARNSIDKETELMIQLLATRQSNITISYSNHNTSDNKSVSPSYLLLQIVRIIKNDNKIGYEDLERILGESKSIVPSNLNDSLSQEEQWLYHLIKEGKHISDEIVIKNHSILNGVKKAKEAKLGEILSIYEGKVIKENLLPTNNIENTISTTALETFASCPYKYFLKYVLNIKEINDKVYEVDRWLDYREQGLLIHEIFEKFYKELKLKEIQKDELAWTEVMEYISKDVLDKYKKEITPLNEYSYIDLSSEVSNLCKEFVKNEIENIVNLPEELEFKFGKTSKNLAGIKIGDNEIYFKGIVDRLDKIDNNTYQIIDYKTGDPSKYEQNSFNKGKNLQNMVYALSLEKILGLEGKITTSNYYFTSNKGKFEKIGMDINKENKEKFYRIISYILELIKEGRFMKNVHKDSYLGICKYCDYKSICKYDKNKDYQYEKFENLKEELIDRWNEDGGLDFYARKG